MVSEIITIKTLSTLIYRVQTFLKFQKSKFQINQSISNMNRLIKLQKKKNNNKKKTRIGQKNTENWINEFLTGEFLVQNSLRPYDTIHSMLQD